VQSLQLAEQSSDWRPISLSPHATWQSFLSLIPPVAMFLAVLSLSWRERQGLCGLVVGLSIVVSFLGLVQAGQGGSAGLQGSMWQADGFSMGVFANRNHFAALIYTALLLAAAFAIDCTKRVTVQSGEAVDTRLLIFAVLSFTVIVALLAGQMISRSRAGLGLTIVALLAIAAMANADAREKPGLSASKLMAAAVILVLIFGSQFALIQIMERFATDPLQDARVAIARNTTAAAWSVMPWGSGLGSFVSVYQVFEKPQDVIVGAFINRAHNDILEVWLETGLAGVGLIVLFAIWLGVTLWRVWWVDQRSGSPLDQLLVRAATLAIILLLAHSLVDYPLRTTALMSVFAILCALLFDPIARDGEPASAFEDSATDLPATAARLEKFVARYPSQEAAYPREAEAWDWPSEQPVPARSTEQPSSRQRTSNLTQEESARWGSEIDWPEDWRNRPESGSETGGKG
jgi:O-antigen ligase